MSSIEKDFDRLALLDDEGWTQNNDYHDFLLRQVPHGCVNALEIGCGTGAFSRRLAQRVRHVKAIDLSSEMIRVARSRSSQLANIDFEVADVMSCNFSAGHFDCIATIATLHHLPLRAALLKLIDVLRPGGVLIVLSTLVPSLLWADLRNGFVLLAMFALLAFAAIGFVDDYAKVSKQQNLGLTSKKKFMLQILVSAVLAIGLLALATRAEYSTELVLPFFKRQHIERLNVRAVDKC